MEGVGPVFIGKSYIADRGEERERERENLEFLLQSKLLERDKRKGGAGTGTARGWDTFAPFPDLQHPFSNCR